MDCIFCRAAYDHYMPTYVYETIPAADSDCEVVRFEFRQSIHDSPLEHHPETGEPVRRIISGGVGIIGAASKSSAGVMPATGCCSGGACGCAN